jgi:hypothetical protein
MFQRLLDPAMVAGLLAGCERTFYECAFCPLVTLWYLMFQRLQADHTLEVVVTDAHEGGADALKGTKAPLSERIRSWATTAYSDARQRLPFQVLSQGLIQQGRRIGQMITQGLEWRGLRVTLTDGSTTRMRPYRAIAKVFPPHANGQQKRRQAKGYWCLMRVVVCFCARTGAVLACATGALSQSEQSLLVQLLEQFGSQDLIVGDRNFGIFWVVQVLRHFNAQGLLRLTEARARKLLAGPLVAGREYALSWAPTRHDRQQPGCSAQAIAGRLIAARVVRKGFRTEVLYLFTTLGDSQAYPAWELVELYGLRWGVELNLRYLKSQMELEQLESKSAQMALKEWWAGLMGYNLIRAVMLAAALEAGLEPLQLSFSKARRQVERFLERYGNRHSGQLKFWRRLLAGVAHSRLPKRRKARPNEPRRKRYIRETFPPLVGSRAKARRRCRGHPAKN